MSRQPDKGAHLGGAGDFSLQGKTSKENAAFAARAIKVIVPSVEGLEVEGTVVFKRKAQYQKPSFA